MPRFTAAEAGRLAAVRHARRPLGHLVWSTLGDLSLTTAQLTTALTQAGLDPTPPPIHPRHAAERATAALTDEPASSGTRLFVRPVLTGPGILVRVLVYEETDAAGRRLHFTQCARLTWTAEHPDQLAVEPLLAPDALPAIAAEALDQLPAIFAAAQDTYPANMLRTIANRLLTGTHAIAVRSAGSVRFVPAAFAAQTQAYVRLYEAFRAVSGHPDTEAYAVQVTERAEHRLVIRRAVERDLGDQLDTWTQEVAALLQQPTVADGVLERRAAQLAEFRAALATYQRLTADQLTTLGAKLEAAVATLQTALHRHTHPLAVSA